MPAAPVPSPAALCESIEARLLRLAERTAPPGYDRDRAHIQYPRHDSPADVAERLRREREC